MDARERAPHLCEYVVVLLVRLVEAGVDELSALSFLQHTHLVNTEFHDRSNEAWNEESNEAWNEAWNELNHRTPGGLGCK